MKSGDTGFRRLYFTFIYSLKGLKSAWQSEAAFRQELLVLAVSIPVLIVLDVSMAERAIMLLSLIFVLIVELLNTAIEVAVDRIGSDFHELSGKAKDLGSAAVLMSWLGVVATWLLILW